MSTDARSSDPRASLATSIEAVVGRGDLETMLEGVLTATAGALHPAIGAIFVSDPDRPGLQLVATHGLDGAAAARLATEVTDPANPFTAAAQGRVVTFDREGTMPDGTAFIGAYLPLVVLNGGVEVPLGSIGLGWVAPRVLDAAERETLVAVASLVAVAVDRVRLASTATERSDWFERMAHTDALTGLANDRTVARVLQLELARAGRQGGGVSLAIFDVDDFQATNREGGNEAGDDVLRRVAEVLAGSVRLVDTVGRIGGDEFILIAPGSAGTTIAQRVLDGIAALPAVAGRPISVSAGVAHFPVDGADADALIAAAKEALSRARADGRGTVATRVAPEG